jgi:drug/metabolite transporter (DMT)-like permease
MRLSLSPRLALVGAVLAVSWGSILARLCVSGPLAVACWRLVFSTAIVLPFAGAHLSGRRSAPSIAAILALMGAGVLLALHFATWITSLRYTSVGSSVLLVSTQPLFGVVLSRIFLRESPSPRALAGVALSLAGTLVIAGGDLDRGASHLRGDLLALAGAAFAAGYFLIGRGVRGFIPFPVYLAGVYASGAAALVAMAGVSGELRGGIPGRDLPWLILMAAGPGVAGHGLLNWSVRKVRAYVVNAALLGEPVLATLYAWIIFAEPPGPWLLAGGTLVVAGLVLVFRESLGEA